MLVLIFLNPSNHIFSSSSLKQVLKEIIEKKHDIDTCKNNWKKNGKSFNQVPTTCPFYDGYSSYDDLLMHETLNNPDKTDGTLISEYDDEHSKNIAEFRIQLTIMEDINDEIIIGCRNQDDQVDKEFESLESSLQTL